MEQQKITEQQQEQREEKRRSLLDEITDSEIRRQADELRLIQATGQQFYNSRCFSDLENASAAATKIQIGRALGIEPPVAMQSLFIIFGRVSFSYQILLTLLRRAGHQVKILQRDEQAARIQFFRDGKEIDDTAKGIVSFSMEDATRAGVTEKSKPKAGTEKEDRRGMYDKWARRMLFARCVSELVNVYCPEITSGFPVLTREEAEDMEPDIAERTQGQAARLRERLEAAQ